MLVELLMVVAILMVVTPALLGGFVASREGRIDNEKRFGATLLLREAKQAVYSVREEEWDNVSTNGTYHPTISSNKWSLAAGPDVVGDYTREIVISSVSRDSSTSAIVQSGGQNDPSTKRVRARVSWDSAAQNEVVTEFYLTRFLDNAAYTQTTSADFATGTHTSTAVAATGDGEVRLAANVKGKWCEPNLSGATIDLPATPNAIWAEEGHIYTASGNSATSSTESYQHTLITNTDPPTPSLHGKFRGYRTYDVWSDSNYGYIATSDNNKEMVIINHNQYSDVAQKIYAESGYFNESGTTDGRSLFVLGGRGYLAAGNYLYVIDLSSNSGSRPQIGSRIQFANSGDYAGKIYAIDQGGTSYVFVSIIGSTVDELKIINATNPNVSAQWRVVGAINIEPNNCSSLESGKSVFVNGGGNRAYISSVNDNNFKEFFILDTGNKSSPSLIGGFATQPTCTNGGGYEAGGMDPSQSTVVNNVEDRAILVGNDATGDAINSQEYQVLDLSDEAHPTKCGGLNFNQGINGVAAVKETDGDAYAYVITGDSATDVKVIAGGPDGSYQEEGTYESAIFDAGSSALFNGYQATFTQPANTTLQWQVASADPVSGSCSSANYQYVGPDGTANTYFTAAQGALPLNDDNSGYENPAQCTRYRATFTTTDYNVTASLQSMIFNYSP